MQSNQMQIAGRTVGAGQPALVVAEIGQNHNGQRRLAEQLIDAASWAGADAIKLVKRDIQCELSREARQWRYESRNSFGRTYDEHRRALELKGEDHAALSQRARQRGLMYFATPCDEPSLELICGLGADALKIASRDVMNLPLVERVSCQQRAVLLSTGMSEFGEIDAAVATLREHAASFAVLQCTSVYPTPYEEAHLRSMAALAERYGCPVGFSDHTRGTLLPPVAVALGASIVEKHLTLDRKLKGTDHACSLEPGEFFQMVSAVRKVELAMGRPDKPVAAEVSPVRAKLGRSLVARRDLPAGARISEEMLALKCPGDGITWQERHRLLGRKLRRAVSADALLTEEDIDPCPAE